MPKRDSASESVRAVSDLTKSEVGGIEPYAPQQLQSCACSPDGCWIAAGSQDGTLRLWDSETGNERDHRIYLRRTPDGSTWATIDHRNNRIIACDAEAWRILGWRTTGPDGFPLILPAETFGPLPVVAS